MTRHIPNLLTLGNLFSGFLGILLAFHGELALAGWMILLAALFDFCDGLAARAFNAKSEIGADLDSLCDIVSFGVLPGIILHFLLLSSHQNWLFWLYLGPIPSVTLVPFLIPALSALRLAKFNNDTEQSETFTGLPTPANAIFFASFPLMLEQDLLLIGYNTYELADVILNPWLLLGCIIVFSLMLVAPVRLFSLKFRPGGYKTNKLQWAFLAAAAVLFVVLLFVAVPFIVLLYLILSLLITHRKHAIQSRD